MTAYRTTAEMELAHPTIRNRAVRFRVERLLQGADAARSQLGEEGCALVDHWHNLQAVEARGLQSAA